MPVILSRIPIINGIITARKFTILTFFIINTISYKKKIKLVIGIIVITYKANASVISLILKSYVPQNKIPIVVTQIKEITINPNTTNVVNSNFPIKNLSY